MLKLFITIFAALLLVACSKSEITSAPAPAPTAPNPITTESTRPWPNPHKNSALDQLKNANMVFSVDKKINIEQSGKMRLIIDLTKTQAELKDAIKQQIPNGTTVEANIKISKLVIAKAVGSTGLTILAVTPDEQAVLDDASTEWVWLVTADKPGEYEVNLTLTAVISVDGSKSQRFLKVFEDTVIIEATTYQTIMGIVEEQWHWAFTTLILPLAIWAWKSRPKKG